MIRNAVIHITNEQPLMADLFELPSATDLNLVCTNLRTMNGTRPVFADHVDSTFVFPFDHIRFVEIPSGADGSAVVAAAEETAAPPEEPGEAEDEAELEIDEDFLRRIRDV
jgi:hypothetical protein